MEVLGETIDDAVGEAFDKAAKILGLPYPGGPHIDRLAKNGDDTFMEFNRSNVANYDYSFSGMKTSFLYALQKHVKETPDFIEKHKADICASYQRALLDVLFDKLEKAIKDTGISNVALAGGVSANSALRKRLHNLGIQKRLNTYVPPLEYTTDNAAMIGIAGYYNYRNGEYADLSISSTAKAKF
jgi:N6-L-threonylcarbamoyladenine synthase